MNEPIILGIESSCDDTSAAIINGNKILSNIAANQTVHQEYGGVVPELASRAHQQNIIPVVEKSFTKANIQQKDISAIGFTRGPGLLGSLLVGTSFAKSLAMSLDVPLIEVNHLQAHILCHFIEDANPMPPKFPFLCLTVSGGHTMIVLVKDYFDMEIIGKTIDDAAGEAFDKIGKIMGLDYPAGPIIDKLAKLGNPDAFTFGKPKLENYDYSFSGIKTSVLYFLQKQLKENPNFIQENVENLCASVQKTIIDVLMKKLEKAAKDYDVKEVAIAGGVSANSGLREAMQNNVEKLGWNVYIPKFEYTTDNAAMIAMVAKLKFERGEFTDLRTSATARYDM
ncbi:MULTISPECIES: tRNA (adenosine(37)-N6)-threonylcarbamoyltransferase complex transferase subunit TsaD [Cloacibacterium]|uniref:tRNA N6-adenosine threonylcarbamoyltransferase n=1 Tax=Cloacibacterium normanense TaxID=237258 RepID=A0A1E5UDB8_9FLAO|nr:MULTISPECIES: tRNA (adenosine(37)-N6)-threonylcarbamoyltransferase complex transferase subunit TsaD [Cloacibacterium]AZI68746.1 tRNA (adenosine(37)-N6)-threonylcarbamoyltransferase complex transferase subunit TsaD [Cloacibacterium normanense]OEL10788.1 tRNA threonylcarbamoyl adenosine modification protein YgjD [Cloacibacterium normanense]WDT67013.1 tRNA (adenosine(37)-N6)-threonylcarbamoyltransferase complex transferase subunit TsaD [Cloacibacterium sp. TD35]SDO80249.1 N6-L-threonylcarbamoyl